MTQPEVEKKMKHKCLKCGNEFEGNFCPECGERYQEDKVCPKCGTTLKGNVKFCTNCGYSFIAGDNKKEEKKEVTPVVKENNVVKVEKPSMAPEKAKKIYNILSNLFSILFMVVSVLMLIFFFTPVAVSPGGELFGETIPSESYGSVFEIFNYEGLSLFGFLIFLMVLGLASLILAIVTLAFKLSSNLRDRTKVVGSRVVYIRDLLSGIGYVLFFIMFIISCVILIQISSEDGGMGIINAGPSPILILVFSLLSCIVAIICVVGCRYLSKQDSSLNKAKKVEDATAESEAAKHLKSLESMKKVHKIIGNIPSILFIITSVLMIIFFFTPVAVIPGEEVFGEKIPSESLGNVFTFEGDVAVPGTRMILMYLSSLIVIFALSTLLLSVSKKMRSKTSTILSKTIYARDFTAGIGYILFFVIFIVSSIMLGQISNAEVIEPGPAPTLIIVFSIISISIAGVCALGCIYLNKKILVEEQKANGTYVENKEVKPIRTYNILLHLPSILFVLLSIAMMFIFMLPIAISPSIEIMGEVMPSESYGSVYEISNYDGTSLTGSLTFLIALGAISLFFSLLILITYLFYKLSYKRIYFGSTAVYLRNIFAGLGYVSFFIMFIISCVIFGQISSEDGGMGIITAGLAPILILVVTLLSCIIALGCMAGCHYLCKKYPFVIEDQNNRAMNAKPTKVEIWMKANRKPVIIIACMFAVVGAAFLGVNIIMSIQFNGTYYRYNSETDELNKEDYYRFDGDKWEDDEGTEGTIIFESIESYNGNSLLTGIANVKLYYEVFGSTEPIEIKGWVEKDVLSIEGTIYAQERHQHYFDEIYHRCICGKSNRENNDDDNNGFDEWHN